MLKIPCSACVCGPTAGSGCKIESEKKKIESGRGLQISSVMVQIVNILGFAGLPISVTMAQLCLYHRKAARDSV